MMGGSVFLRTASAVFRASTVPAAAALLIATPVLAGDRIFLTPSGQPEATFKAIAVNDAASKVVNNCMNAGWAIVSQSPNQVVCELRMDLMRSALTQALIGNTYSTTPRSFVRVSLAQVGEDARAQVAAWVETQMAFGQMRQQPYTDDATFDRLVSFLLNAGASLTPGTRRNGLLVGFGGQVEPRGKQVSILIKTVGRSTPAENAGLLVGDRILKANGKPFKSMEDLISKLAKVPIGTQYPILIERGGTEQTLTLIAKGWPVAGTAESDSLVAGMASAPPTSTASTTSTNP
jgi:hypothetical protein